MQEKKNGKETLPKVAVNQGDCLLLEKGGLSSVRIMPKSEMNMNVDYHEQHEEHKRNVNILIRGFFDYHLVLNFATRPAIHIACREVPLPTQIYWILQQDFW